MSSRPNGAMSCQPRLTTFALADLVPVPWKNGGGTTREIGSGRFDLPDTSSAAAFDWRLSLADIRTDGPFSVFPGIDRYAMLVAGRSLTLSGPDGHWHAVPFAPFAFAGDLALDATLGEQAPAQCLNLMVRRGAARGHIGVHVQAVDVAATAAAIVIVLGGTWSWQVAPAGDADADVVAAGDTVTLHAGQGAVCALPAARLVGTPAELGRAGARAIVVTLVTP